MKSFFFVHTRTKTAADNMRFENIKYWVIAETD